MRHLAPQAPAVDLVYAKPYLTDGLPVRALDAKPIPGAPNAGELILALKSAPAAVDFTSGSDRAGGFVAPNLSVRGISRALGAIGESGNAPSPFESGTFDPTSFLGLVLLELGLEACACLSVDLGVASGSVSISVGVYLRLEADKGLLTAYFRIRGEVDVLGLISASITIELSLAYYFETGKLFGRACLVVEVEVLFFSASVEISVERRLAGSKGDPTMYQVMPPDDDGMNADWVRYCDAFAPVPA